MNDWEEKKNIYTKVFSNMKVFSDMWGQASEDSENEELKRAKKELEKAKIKAEKEKTKRLLHVEAELGFQLEKLSLKEGDIILVHLTCKPKPGLQELVRQLLGIKPVKDYKIPVLIIPSELELSAMDEKEMNAAGWYKRGHRLMRPIV